MKRKALRAVALGLLGLGLWQAGSGLWIPAKAALAQLLLARAWAATENGETRSKPWPWADTWPVARLRVPRLGVAEIVLAGASGRTLAFGPGHLAGTATPGNPGHSVLAGHRDTHFAFLQEIEPGDRIEIERADGKTTEYRVEELRIVDGDKTQLEIGSIEKRLTLVTCYPFDAVVPGGPLRYVVSATSR